MNTATVSLYPHTLALLVAAAARIVGVKFVGINYRSKESGELARRCVILGASYENALRTSLDTLLARPFIVGDMRGTKVHQANIARTEPNTPARKAANAALKAFQDGIGPERAAAAELAVSYETSLAAHDVGQCHPGYTQAGMWEEIPGITGLRFDRVSNKVQILGMEHSKKVLEPGTHKKVNSSAKTIAKRKLEKSLPVGRVRSYSVEVGALESARIAGSEIEVW